MVNATWEKQDTFIKQATEPSITGPIGYLLHPMCIMGNVPVFTNVIKLSFEISVDY